MSGYCSTGSVNSDIKPATIMMMLTEIAMAGRLIKIFCFFIYFISIPSCTNPAPSFTISSPGFSSLCTIYVRPSL